MPAIEVQRQMLPMFASPNQGARFYNPDLPQTEPFVPGHRTCASARRPACAWRSAANGRRCASQRGHEASARRERARFGANHGFRSRRAEASPAAEPG